MPRKPRFYVPGVSVHVVHRGNNRDPIFFRAADYLVYLNWLEETAERYDCLIHAYVLMTNHVHLLATPATKTRIREMMQHVGRCYVPLISKSYNCSGTLWECRYKR